jgi:hypothetical protein
VPRARRYGDEAGAPCPSTGQQVEAQEQRFRKLSEQAQRDTAGLTMAHWFRRLHELMVRN